MQDQICAALGRYYKIKEVDGYFDDDGVGKFSAFCEENGFDDDMIQEELAEEPGQSQLAEFEADGFPGTTGLDPEAKQIKILDVIKKCAENPKAFMGSDGKYEPLEVTPEQLKVTEKEVKEAKDLYKSQLQTLFDTGMDKDKSILKMLAVGRKIGAPYLMYLADVYTRERIRGNDDGLKLAQFMQNNKHCKKLSNMGVNNISDEIMGAITSFFGRISPQIMLKPSQKIVADVAKTCELFARAIEFVHNKASKGAELTCPFQFDATFAFQKSKLASNDVAMDEEEDDDDDDDDDADEEKKQEAGGDYFGDIKQRCETEKLSNSVGPVQVGARAFIDPFKEFVEKNEMGKKHKDYPHKRRFCAIVDRRKGEAETDELTFFEPPANCNSFPEGEYVQLWYFDSTKTCILPNEGYNAGAKDDKKEPAAEQKPTDKAITSGTGCGGTAVTLSFHVEGADEIRCYLCVNGGMMRMLPGDLNDVLPLFFDEDFGDNKKWKGSEAATKLVERITPMLCDAKFNAFYESCI